MRGSGATAALIGGVYLVLWLLGIPPRWSAAGVVTMKTNMALAQVLAGAALALLGGGDATRRRRAIGIVLSALVLAIGLGTLCEHAFRVDLGIDQLIAKEPPGALNTLNANRMGPPGALSLTLLGAGLLALAWKRRAYRWLAAATLILVLVPAVGFLYGIGRLHSNATIIAWPTVIALLALGVGLALADLGDGGSTAVLWRDDAGGVLLRRMLVPGVLAPLALGYLRLQGEHLGLYERHVGTGIFAVSLSATLALLLWRSALRLSAAAVEQTRAEQECARLAAIVEHTDDAIVSEDLDGRIQTWNGAAERLFGWSAAEAVGRSIELIFPPESHGEAREILARIAAGEAVPRFEAQRVSEGGARIDVLVTVSPIRGRDGRIVGASKIVRDITERKRAEVALREANDQLREADRRKDEFLGMLSHELRNPLAPIRNSLFILDRAEPTGERARRAREVASRQVAHLTRLVDDLLDVTRIARGKIELRRAHVDLGALARRTADDHRALMQDRGLELGLEVSPDPMIVSGDGTRLAQVLGNLLSNAAKFTPAGGRVVVTAGVEHGAAVVRVRDTGPGIDPGLLGSIFEPFTQAKQTLARSEGGLGLGLALVKGLVELHGGEVRARSDGPGRGAELVVKLPLEPAPARAPEQDARGRGERRALSRLRVLVVDDNADAADSLAELVELFGHEAQVAHDGPSAIARARERRPDVVLCDIGLPGMSGYEVAQALRASGERRMRLIAVSGYAQPEDVKRAEEAGFERHIAKPPAPGEIEQLLA